MSHFDSSANETDYLDDPDRLEALSNLNILDSSAEETFDSITRCAKEIFDVELATIHLVDSERQWVKASSNAIRADDTPVGETFCEYTVRTKDELVLVPDLKEDPRFQNSEFVTGPSALRFYAGMPLITSEGHTVGTLCLLDTRARVIKTFDDRKRRVFRELASMAVKTMELRSTQVQLHKSFLQNIQEDGLTGFMSRRGLLAQLHRHAYDNAREDSVYAMIEIRLKSLGRIFRAYGSSVSNEILLQMAERLKFAVSADDILARVESHSLLIARRFHSIDSELSRCVINEWGEGHTETILGLLEEPFLVDNESFYVVANIGVAFSTEAGESSYSVLEKVEGALFEAERTKTATSVVQWSNRELDRHHYDGLTIERRLRKAVEDENLAVLFQPIVDLRNNNVIVGAEALVRWPQESGPSIGPDVFIPLAEELGLIDRLGLWVFAEACRTLRHWRDVSGKDLWMAVNFAPKQLQDSGLADRLTKITSQAKVAPENIKIEITESGLIDNFEAVKALLDTLIEAGFKLALDDFGTGHSSLSRLIHLPFSVLKVDRAFVSDSPEGSGASVVSSLSTLAKSLGLEKVGEGVETERQEHFLRAEGYEFGQGYLYSKPVTAEAFLELIGTVDPIKRIETSERDSPG